MRATQRMPPRGAYGAFRPRWIVFCAEQVIRAFQKAGFAVTAIDFSQVAVEQANASLAGMRGQVIMGDFFEHDFDNIHFD